MEGAEKRKFKRFGGKYDVSCTRFDSIKEQFQEGHTVNLCPGGLYFKTRLNSYEPGDLIKIKLMIPPAHGLLEFGGSMAGYAKVLRIEEIEDSDFYRGESKGGYGVAVEFCRPLRLCL